MSELIYATLREDGETLHHLMSTTGITGILATAGLLAEAINYRNGYKIDIVGCYDGQKFSLSIVAPGIDGKFAVNEYTIRAVGKFWLKN
jgi:hypothetical protein